MKIDCKGISNTNQSHDGDNVRSTQILQIDFVHCLKRVTCMSKKRRELDSKFARTHTFTNKKKRRKKFLTHVRQYEFFFVCAKKTNKQK